MFQKLIDELNELRSIQIIKLNYTEAYDDTHSEDDWEQLIISLCTEESTPKLRTRMLRVASVAIACIESIDRKLESY